MSLLRCASPGRPVVLVDEGPQTHVPVHFRPGGALVSAQGWGKSLAIPTNREVHRSHSRSAAATAARNAERAVQLAEPRPICGAMLRVIGEPCARTPGHRYDHQSAARMELMRLQRKGRR